MFGCAHAMNFIAKELIFRCISNLSFRWPSYLQNMVFHYNAESVKLVKPRRVLDDDF
jgi:hypothetical protein